MFYQIFLSPEVKRRAIISNKDGIYELPHDLSKLGSSEIKNSQENLKTS